MNIPQLALIYKSILYQERETERRQVDCHQNTLAALVEEYVRAKSGPDKPLTIPAIFGRSYDENFISDYLAFMLDPAQNGIGAGPLAALLGLCGIDAGELPLAEVIVSREYTIEGGRIDLLLEWTDTLVLGIENKIFSSEGAGQTPHYARVILRLFEGIPCHFVYLTPGPWKARSRKFQPLSYAQLLSAFRRVSLPDDVAARPRVLWEDLLEHLEVYIVMSERDHFEFSEKAQLYVEHQKMFDDLKAAFNREWGEALAYIEGRLYAHLDGGPWTTRFSRSRYHWHQVFKPHWASSTRLVHYEYWFTLRNLQQQKIEFMVDVEGKQADELLALFDHRYPALEAAYQQRNIFYRHPYRRNAIAYKNYPITQDIDQVAQVFIDAFDEFRFLEKEIDHVLAEIEA